MPIKMEKPARRAGVLEALVALCIVVSLAGVTAPIVATEVIEGREDQAVVDMVDILDGLRGYSHDTLFLPTGDRGRTDVTWLWGPGHLPVGHQFDLGGEGRPLDDVLLNDSMGGPGWNGPYLPNGLSPDPWGNAYLLNVGALVDPRETAMILSAGPDGLVQTAPGDRKVQGDDIVLPLN